MRRSFRVCASRAESWPCRSNRARRSLAGPLHPPALIARFGDRDHPGDAVVDLINACSELDASNRRTGGFNLSGLLVEVAPIMPAQTGKVRLISTTEIGQSKRVIGHLHRQTVRRRLAPEREKLLGRRVESVQADDVELRGANEGIEEGGDGLGVIVLDKELARRNVTRRELDAPDRDPSDASANDRQRRDTDQARAAPGQADQRCSAVGAA